MSRLRAPIALRIPISRVRSRTLTSMMFMIPMPPTTRLIDAIPASSSDRNPVMVPKADRSCAWSMTVKSSSAPGGDPVPGPEQVRDRDLGERDVAGSAALTEIDWTASPATKRSRIVESGMNTWSSRMPLGWSTPMTRNGTPPTRMSAPTADSSSLSASAVAEPMTATRRPARYAGSVMNDAAPDVVGAHGLERPAVIPDTVVVVFRSPAGDDARATVARRPVAAASLIVGGDPPRPAMAPAMTASVSVIGAARATSPRSRASSRVLVGRPGSHGELERYA